MKFNKIYYDFFKETANEKIIILYGGRRSGKSIAILQWLYLQMISKDYLNIQMIAKTSSLLETGIKKDFDDIIDKEHFNINLTKKEYLHRTNLTKFLSINKTIEAANTARTMGKATHRFINECNNFDKETVDNLIISVGNSFGEDTDCKVIFDFNPTKKFWIDEFVNENNTLKTTWRDNYVNLNKLQIDEFERWTDLGKKSTEGSAHWWRWQVYCEGNYAGLWGSIFTPDNIKFTSTFPFNNSFTIFIDPSTMHGNDYLAMNLATCEDGKMIVCDTFSLNEGSKLIAVQKLKEWNINYKVSHCFCETNGEISKNFYNLLLSNNIKCSPYSQHNNKFDRIMAHYDFVIEKTLFVDNEQNRNYVKQIYEFSDNCENDDNIDALVGNIMLNIALGNLKQSIII